MCVSLSVCDTDDNNIGMYGTTVASIASNYSLTVVSDISTYFSTIIDNNSVINQ